MDENRFADERDKFNKDRCPVKEGEQVDVEIISIGEKGDGIAKYQGYIIFIPDTAIGDKVKIEIIRVLSKFGFAKVI